MSFFNLFSSFIVTTLSLYALKPVANKVPLVDFPGGRKTHDRATPIVGGLGIYLGTFSMCLFIPNILSQYGALGFIGASAVVAGDLELYGLVSILGCAVAAFLTMNFRLLCAMIYPGDTGSTMLEFMLAWLLISNSQGSSSTFSPVITLRFLAIPLFYAVYLLIFRPLRKISPFIPGIDHIHHKLIRKGLNIKQTV